MIVTLPRNVTVPVEPAVSACRSNEKLLAPSVIEATLIALLPLLMVESADSVTPLRSICWSVVATVPPMFVADAAVVSRPPTNVLESAAPSPSVTLPVLRNVVSPATEFTAPTNATL